MKYFEQYNYLKNIFDINKNEIDITRFNEAKIYNINFFSESLTKFPCGNEYQSFNTFFKALVKFYLSQNYFSNNYILKMLEVPDDQVEENKTFNYTLFKNNSALKSKSIVILLHGLNERNWNKYLPWAYSIHHQTNKSVVLFPQAFHINRAPLDWSDFRIMNEVAKERKKLLPGLKYGTFANAAISTRLQFVPQRFIFSGLQTYYDIVNFVKDIRQNKNPFIEKDATIDLLGYSIGAFLSEILLMSNPDNLFSDSRLFVFCGGPTLNFMNPVAKSILDSEAFNSINRFLVYDFDKDISNDERLSAFFKMETIEGIYFKSLLNFEKYEDLRESRFKELENQIFNCSLEKDNVMPYSAVNKTLIGNTNSRLKSEVLDFPFPYSHETPFPLLSKYEDSINKSFDLFINKTCSFLN